MEQDDSEKIEYFSPSKFKKEFTCLSIFDDNRLILRGIYDHVPVFIKAFSSIEQLKNYKYISSVEKHINPTIKFFMIKYMFFDFLEDNNIQQIKNHGKPNEGRNIYYSTKVDTAVIDEIPKIFVGDKMYFIVTEDIELKNMCNFVSIEQDVEQEFSQIIEKYNKLKDIDYISSNILNIKKEISIWKEKIEKFKKLEISEGMRSKILEIEQEIMKKKEIIKNLDINYNPEWYKVNIKPLDIEEFKRNFTDLIIFGDKDSASKSLILKSKYEGAPIFIKAFSSTEERLINELKIYKYISSVEKHINPTVKSYMDDYFIRLKKKFSINKETFFDFLEKNNIQRIKNQGNQNEERNTYYSTKVDTAVFNKIPEIFKGDNMYFIVTEDIEGETLEKMCKHFGSLERERIDKFMYSRMPDYKAYEFYKNLNIRDPDVNPRKELINIIFELIYGLYLLNKYFRIEHGDLHFNNVIIKKINPINKNFIIGNTSIKKEVI